jgi:hypothetical protein
MPKKTTRAARTGQSQQRTKEEQWRRRMASQAQSGAAGVALEQDEENATFVEDGASDTKAFVSPTPSSAPRPASRPASTAAQARTQTSTMASSQRKAATASRNTRVRLTAETLSMEDEMYYVRSDIRRLIILTAICLAVLIALVFIIPS